VSLLFPAERCLVDFLLSSGAELAPFRLVDVGVSGGLHPAWRRWHDRLIALGLDAFDDEVDRLSAAETNSSIKYLAARLASPSSDPTDPERTNYSLHRSQPYLATAVLKGMAHDTKLESFRELQRNLANGIGIDYPLEANYANVKNPMSDPFFGYYARRFARKEAPRMTSRLATLDQVLEETNLPVIDFLKIDTDGYDFDVLRGGESAIASGCLAIEIEIQFQGRISQKANTFCNIDGFLRDHGFTLFKLAPVSYGRSALPRPFLLDIPAQTESGQVVWADALYARDLADANYALKFGLSPTTSQLQNLALIFDLYGMEDAAAEILLAAPNLFAPLDDATLLNFLAGKLYGVRVTYRDVIEAFMTDPIHFHKKLGARTK
jgi:FkbM family methyltransferase